MKYTPDFKTRFRILKNGKISMLVSALLAGATISFAAPAANQLPTSGSVLSGNVNVSSTSNTMNINQSSAKSIINWNTYSIGKDATVNYNFAQSGSSSLNRVVGNNPSEIYGRLNANGNVILINPNGVVFGNGSRINVGSIVTTTMNMSDGDYLNGKMVFSRENSIGSIVNEGEITAAENGFIALLAPTVINNGVLRATMGTVSLASGDKVELSLDGSGLKTLIVEPSTIKTLIENKALIEADGGLIYIGAKEAQSLIDGAMNIKNSGTLQANSMDELLGKVVLDGNGIEVSGTIQALDGEVYVGNKDVQKTVIKSGALIESGFVETSAKVFDLEGNVNIRADHWLIDPTDLTIDSSNVSSYNSGIASGDTTITTDGTLYINDVLTVDSHRLTINYATDMIFGMPSTFAGFTGKINIGASGDLTINSNPYTIVRNQAGLAAMTNTSAPNNVPRYYALASDLALSGYSGSSMVFGTVDRRDTFNGLGHSVSGLSSVSGLFGQTANATISGVLIESPSISSPSSNVGALIGTASNTTVKNSYVHGGSVVSTDIPYGLNVGGLIGKIDGDQNVLSNLGSSATVSGASYVGGLIGQATIYSGTNLVATGNVEGTKTGIGGLIGYLVGGCNTIDSSHATGTVTKTAGNTDFDNIGGLIGYMVSTGSVYLNNSYATGTITSSTTSTGIDGDNVGGLVGNAHTSELHITNSYSTSTIAAAGQKNVGGLIGYTKNSNSIQQRSYYTGTSISGGDNTGGFVGKDDNGMEIKNSYVTTSISGGSYVGGMVGYGTADLSQNYAITSLTGTNVGGLVGSSTHGGISGSYYSTDAYNGDPTGDASWNARTDNGGIASKKTTAQLTGSTAIAALNYYYDGTAITDNDVSTSDITTWGESQAWSGGVLTPKGAKTCPTCSNPTGTFNLSASLSALAGITRDELVDNDWGLSNITATSTDSSVVYNTDYKMQLLSGSTLLADSKTGTNWTDGYLDGLLPGIYTLKVVPLTGGTAPADATVKITAPVYVKAADGTSIYGDAPTFTYNVYDRSGALSVITLTGTAVNSVAGSSTILASNTANVGSYSYQYTSGLTHGYYIPSSYLEYDSNANVNATWTITPRPINITVAKTYDGTVDFTTGYILSTTAGHNVVNGDTVNAAGALKTTSANASATAYTKSGPTVLTDISFTLALSNSNYMIDEVSATINKAPLRVVADDQSKTYDKQTFTAGGGAFSYTYDGFVSGENATITGITGTVSYTGTATSGVNAGAYTITPGGLNATAATNYLLSYVNGALSINKKALSIDASSLGSISVTNKVYDGTTTTSASALSGLTLNPTVGVLSGDSVSITGLNIQFPDKNVGNDKTLIGSITSGSGTGYANYDISLTGLMASITPKEVTLNATKVYDGTTSMTGHVTIAGLIGSETLNYTGAMANNKNVVGATYIDAITLADGTGATATTGGLASNYMLPSLVSYDAAKNVATITPKTVAISATKVYDSTTDMTPYTIVSTGISGEALTFTNAAANSKNVASTAYINAITLANGTGGLASNYSADTTGANANNSASITPKSITLSAEKTYDGARTLTGSQITMGGLIGSETLTYTNAKTNDKDVLDATYITDITLANGTNDGISTNYVLPSLAAASAGINTAVINKASLQVIADDKSKTYDKTIYGGAYTYTYAGFAAGENATTAGITGTVAYTDSAALTAINAGTYNITPSGLTSTAANYDLSYVNGALTINKKTLTITSADLTGLGTVDNKVYDGTVLAANKTDLTYNVAGNTDLISGDSFIINSLVLDFVNKNVGDSKALIASSLSGAGTGMENYSVNVSGLTANITQREVTLSATKEYDASTSMTNKVSIGNLVQGETLNYTGATANSKDVNVNGTVVGATYINAITLQNGTGANVTTGGLASNYKTASLTVAEAGKNTAVITPKTVTSSLTGTISRAYDSTVDYSSLTNSNFSLVGFVGSESASVTKTAGTYNDKGVLDAATMTTSLVNGDFTANGSTLLSNYTLPITATGAATITKKTVDLSATKVYDGGIGLSGKVTVTTGVDGETLNYSGATASDKNVATSGKYINAITLVDGSGDINNYQLPTLNASNALVTITQKEVALSATKVYDGDTDMTNKVTIVTGITGTDGTSEETLNYTGATANNQNVVGATYIDALSLVNGANGGLASNYRTPLLTAAETGKNTATVTPKTLTASLTGTITKIYNGTLDYSSLTNSNFSLIGIVGSEGASVTKTAGTYNDKDVVDADTLTTSLVDGDFTANGSTLLSNYTLPTIAEGAATITPRTITYAVDDKTVLLGTKMINNWPNQAFGDMTPEMSTVTPKVFDKNGVDVSDKAIVGTLTPNRYVLQVTMEDPNFSLAETGNTDGTLTVLSPVDPITVSTNVFNNTAHEVAKPKDMPLREIVAQVPSIVQVVNDKGNVVADNMGVNGGAMQVQDGKSLLTMIASSTANPFSGNEKISLLDGGIKIASLDLPAGILADLKPVSPLIVAPAKQGNVELAQGSGGNLNARLIPNDTNMFTFTVKEAVASILGIKEVSDAKATLQDGKALPNWLKFDKTTQTFSAKNPPEGELPLSAKVNIVAKDGKTASMIIEVSK